MSYTIYKSNGTAVVIPDNAVDSVFYNTVGGSDGNGMGVQLVGRNTVNYGTAIAQNFLQMTENFSSANVPSDATSLQGQLWFNRASSTAGNLYLRLTETTSGGIANWAKVAVSDGSGNITSTTFTGDLIGNAASASTLLGGSTGAIVYQGAPNTTSFLTPGTSGFVLTSTGTSSAPQWARVTNLGGGGPGALVFQGAVNVTSFLNPGPAGYVLTSGGSTSAPVWAATSPGTVTSINGSGGTTGLTLSGGPITSSGTLTLGGVLAIANGGTGNTAGHAVTATNATNAVNANYANTAGSTATVTAGGTVTTNSVVVQNAAGAGVDIYGVNCAYRMSGGGSGEVKYYDVNTPDVGIYNYTFRMDTGAFRMAFSTNNIPYEYGNELFTFNYQGNMVAAGNVTAFSDARLKKDLVKIDNALSKVDQLTGYTYIRKDTGAKQTGLLAQDIEKVLPEAVDSSGDYKAVAYGNMMGLMVEAIKELKSELLAVRAELDLLKKGA